MIPLGWRDESGRLRPVGAAHGVAATHQFVSAWTTSAVTAGLASRVPPT